MSLLLCLLCLLLVPLATAGLALMHTGLGRSRSAAHAMLATLCVTAVSALAFVTVGYSLAGVAGGPSFGLLVHGTNLDLAGAQPIFARAVRFDGTTPSLVLALQILTSGLAAMIPVSAGTDRWRLVPLCLSTAFFAGVIYPLFAHWAWGGGWLAKLGSQFGLGAGFLDVGGAGTIHVAGGLGALSVAWILGPRSGKYTEEGMATAIPGHNIALVLLGCILALVGWMGLNSAGGILFYGVAPGLTVKVIINTLLASSAACLAALVTTRVRYRKPDASISANGWTAGLVASSAGCAFLSPGAAMLVGMVAGLLVTYLVEILELRLYIDDPGGAISVHAGAGAWGLLAAGIFGNVSAGTRGGQVLAQLVGLGTLLGCIFPLTHALHLLLNRRIPFRVDAAGGWQGMDIRELGAGAYPEFVVHPDEFRPR